MTKISQTQYPGAGVSRDQRRKKLLALRDQEKLRQETEAKQRDAKRKAQAKAELAGAELWNGGV